MISRFVKSLILRRGNPNFLKAQIRKSGVWAYRAPPPPPEKKFVIIAEVMGGFFWWWVLWHLWHDYGHVIGEFPYPDPSEWTDEELGVPPDDYD